MRPSDPLFSAPGATSSHGPCHAEAPGPAGPEARDRDRGRHRSALGAYAVGILRKQSGGVTRCLEHATPEQLRVVIAALARDAKRHGRRVN